MNSVNKPIVLTEPELENLIPKLNVPDLMKNAFSSLANKTAIQPPQTLSLFPHDKGDYITYLGVMAEQGVFGAKLSPYIAAGETPIVTAWTQLMSLETGQPLLWCDSNKLTIERTAGTTALAIEHLALKESENLALVGAGRVALAHLKHVLPLRAWKKISVFSPELASNEGLCADILSIDHRIHIENHVEQAVHNADVIMLCTSSATPVMSQDLIKSSALITSISTNAVNAHEVPPTMLNDVDVYCDYKETTPESAGEMKLATQNHGWDKGRIVGDLAELVTQQCPLPNYERPVFFRSIGLGLEDIAIAYGVWKLATEVK